MFIEIIQRLGCIRKPDEAPFSAAEAASLQAAAATPADALPEKEQAAGCGGFGKGNFSELFKRIEDYERTLNV